MGAFGKDDAHLANIGGFGASFGQQAAQSLQRGPRGSRGTAAYWKDSFDISEQPATPDTFRILRGAYQQQYVNRDSGELFVDTRPYLFWREHFAGGLQRGGICSAGPFHGDKNKRQPCLGCDVFWRDYDERKAKKNRGDNTKGPNRISLTDKFAFTVWDYGLYFEMPDVDRTGQFRINQRTGQPYTTMVKAYNPNEPRFAGHRWEQGRLQPWSVGSTWFQYLHNYNTSVVGNCCSSCGAHGSVYSLGWYCGNPQCGQMLFDANNTTMSVEELEAKKVNRCLCPHCGQNLFPQERVGCQNCARGQRATIFDVDLVGFKQRSGDGNQYNLFITSFIGPCPIRVQDPKVLETIQPLDLVKRYEPTPLDKQQEMWGSLNMTAPQAMAPQYPQYPQQQQYPPPGAQQQPQWAPPPPPPTAQPPWPPAVPQAMPAPQMQQPTMGGAAAFPPPPTNAVNSDWAALLEAMNNRFQR